MLICMGVATLLGIGLLIVLIIFKDKDTPDDKK